MRVGVVSFPGTIDGRDVIRALDIAGIESTEIWHTTTEITDVDALILPGGQSYGDYLRPGALAQTAPVITAIKQFAEAGKPVLGIGNGFQILLEAGLLEGALTSRAGELFERRDAVVAIVDNGTPFTNKFAAGEEIVLPVRNTHGEFTGSAETLAKIEAEGLVVLRYADAKGADGLTNIAGVKSSAGNVVGVTPHPEFAVELGFGPDTDERMRSGIDGLRFFLSLISG